MCVSLFTLMACLHEHLWERGVWWKSHSWWSCVAMRFLCICVARAPHWRRRQGVTEVVPLSNQFIHYNPTPYKLTNLSVLRGGICCICFNTNLTCVCADVLQYLSCATYTCIWCIHVLHICIHTQRVHVCVGVACGSSTPRSLLMCWSYPPYPLSAPSQSKQCATSLASLVVSVTCLPLLSFPLCEPIWIPPPCSAIAASPVCIWFPTRLHPHRSVPSLPKFMNILSN